MTDWTEVERFLADAVGVVFPAAQLVVADQGRSVVEIQVGAATRDTLFDLASLTKPLATAALVARMLGPGESIFGHARGPGVTGRHLPAPPSGRPAGKPLVPGPGASSPRAGIVEAVRKEPPDAEPGERARYSDLGFILLGDLVELQAGA